MDDKRDEKDILHPEPDMPKAEAHAPAQAAPVHHKHSRKEQAKKHATTAWEFSKKHAMILTLIAVLLLQFIPNGSGTLPWGGLWMRLQQEKLSIADTAAQQTVDNYVNQQATLSVNQQYPNLPDASKQQIIAEQVKKLETQNKDILDQ